MKRAMLLLLFLPGCQSAQERAARDACVNYTSDFRRGVLKDIAIQEGVLKTGDQYERASAEHSIAFGRSQIDYADADFMAACLPVAAQAVAPCGASPTPKCAQEQTDPLLHSAILSAREKRKAEPRP